MSLLLRLLGLARATPSRSDFWGIYRVPDVEEQAVAPPSGDLGPQGGRIKLRQTVIRGSGVF